MAMGQQQDRQGDLMAGWSGHVFCDRLQSVLIEGGFDGFAEAICKPCYAAMLGAPSVPLGRHFRMHLVGCFEGMNFERGLEWRCGDSLSLREFLRLSNRDWVSRSDPEAGIARMKEATTHLACKPEHAVDLDTGAVAAAELHPADEGDTTTLSRTLAENPAELVTDKGCHSRAVLKDLDDSPWKTRIGEPMQKGFSRWRGDEAARRAVTDNRGRENVHKRYLLHVAGHNLSLPMRQPIGAGTPKEAVAGRYGCCFVLIAPAGSVPVAQIVLIVSEDRETAFAALCFVAG